MRQLAQFEGYAERLAVTEADLIARGLGNREDPQVIARIRSTEHRETTED
jgi:hypothetical protein